MLAFFVLAAVALARVVRSPFGRVLRGVEDNERRMVALGYAVRRFKLAAFVVGATIAGVAGSLEAQFNGYISPEALFSTTSGEALVMVSLGRDGSLAGTVRGAAA